MRLIACFLSLFFLIEQANAANDKVLYEASPSWITPQPLPMPKNPSASTSGAVRVEYSDIQVRIDDRGINTYTAYKLHLLQPEALAVGNVNLVWSPDSTEVTVHRLLVHRDGEVIDILETSRFNIFQREGRLEQAMLDGLLTANLQIPGLRVGDAIEFATTSIQKDPTFPETSFGVLQIAHDLAPGTYRLSLDWDDGQKPRWQASKDFEPKIEEASNGIFLNLANPGKFITPAKAPVRYSTGRFIQFTDFKDWADVSSTVFDLFKQASRTGKPPSLQAEIDDIARQHSAKRERAVAALALVQDSVRYVYVGINGSNFTPATIGQTWERRFGDCKGKTALLMGVLDKLGIDAEPVLVSSGGGDGFDSWLPTPGLFDHVLVRIKINGKRYWLDGTRQGDHRLLIDNEIGYRWVLPLSASGGALEAVKYSPPERPSELDYLDIDATGGFEEKAQVTWVRVFRGDQALVIHQALRSQSNEAASQSLRQSFQGGWVKPEQVSWRYHNPTGAIAITVSGPAELDWDVDRDSELGKMAKLSLPGGGFYPPNKKERPAAQDQSAPFVNKPKKFSCSVTRVRLPDLDENSWIIKARSIDQNIGGVAYYRVANLEGGTVSMIRSSRTFANEVSSAEAEKSNKMIPDFDNSMAWVKSVSKKLGDGFDELGDRRLPDFDAVNWVEDPWACRSGKTG